MIDNTDNNRIAKNTIFLYFRTILIMLVSLYTSRVVLNTLGVEDFGVYNAVGGFVAMFAVISGALSNSVSRYITFGIGKGDSQNLRNIFCTSINIQVILSLLVLLLCEIVGVWFLNSKMSIPSDRVVAANWVLQCALISFVINLISVPYNACIIAHEHMNVYAYISIIDAILKLSVVYLLSASPFDKLITYSLLLVLVSLIVRLLYRLYCKHKFEECRYHFIHDVKLFKEMLSFAGWNFFTNAASVLNIQGVSVLVNVYFGVLLNSARGISMQVESAVNQLITTFTTAVNPQITKSYAHGDRDRMNMLVCKGAKFAFFLLLIIAIPLLLETDFILKVWLKNVPDYATTFVRLSIVGSMITILGNTGYTACMATGKIRKYALWITAVASLVFFLSWIAYSLGAPVESAYYFYIIGYSVVQVVRLVLMKHMLDFPIRLFFNEVICKIIWPSVLSFIVPFLITKCINVEVYRFVITCIISLIWTSVCIILLGLTKQERAYFYKKIIQKIKVGSKN